MITTLAQAIVFAGRAKVPQSTLLDIISYSALNAPMYQTKGKSMIERNFSPRFLTELMLKDINLILDAAKDVGAPLPTIEAAQKLFRKAVRKGYAKEDYSAVLKAL